MPSAAQRPYLVEPPAAPVPADSQSSRSFDPLLVLRAAALQEDTNKAVSPDTPHAAARMIRRRGSIQQGRALEMLGHAVEYLIDSRMFDLRSTTREPEAEAVKILMKLSRGVFHECPEVVPMRTRIARMLRIVR